MLDYIKFSFRILNKNKLYAFISVLGLAVGISCCILISLFVINELSYDDFHKDHERIYRITTVGSNYTAGLTDFGIGPTLKKDYPEIENFCRILNFGNFVDVKYEDKQFNEENIIVADSSFFEMFSFKILDGNKETILSKPKTVVISESMSEKYFGNESPLHKVLKINKKDYEVVGVVEDNPGNSDIRYNAIVSMSSLSEKFTKPLYEDWFHIICVTYLKFYEVPNVASFQEHLDEFGEKYVRPWGEENDTEEMFYSSIQPIKEVHFDNTKEFDSPKGNINYIYIFSSVALFVLLIACINYINMSLSQSTNRAKEIGVRKTLGSDSGDIKTQFLTETSLITLIAFFIGLILVELLIPMFNTLTLKNFQFVDLLTPTVLVYSIVFLVLIIILSGIYPAFVLSNFDPIQVFKGHTKGKSNIGVIRKILLILQFSFSISMIISSLFVYQQMNFMKNKDLGFDDKHTLVFRIPTSDSAFVNKVNFIQETLEKNKVVSSTALSSTVPGNGFAELMFRIEQDSILKDQSIRFMRCDEDFLKLLDLNIISGRNFNKEISTDTKKSFIINRTAAEKFGWGKKAVGKRMQWGLLPNNQAENDGVVVGVVEDFHMQSLHNKIEPIAIQYLDRKNYLSVKLQGEDMVNEISSIKSFWQEQLGDRIMESFFLDDRFNEQYHSEERMLKVFNYFTIVSLILSSLGLFALTSYMMKQKTKEIGVRKILGASLNDIIFMISKDFLKLLGIGLVIASLPTVYFIDKWLNDFSYRIDIGVFPILISGLVTMLIVLIVVVYHTLKMNLDNPIEALKHE